ncbi:uncharacterized protein LOC110428603 [Herrania umbratica]|uniref:Uncharacterized protein LOC110428603 n=1 Tax=Herrania umbratica TaxID=108875 RepID=A0A6J1BPE4_9ROSI|nr:uncharacterized protein LOC110428603 [Herrania umbratica]
MRRDYPYEGRSQGTGCGYVQPASVVAFAVSPPVRRNRLDKGKGIASTFRSLPTKSVSQGTSGEGQILAKVTRMETGLNYLTCTVATEDVSMGEKFVDIKMVSIINECEDVFPDEVLELPSEREDKFCINLTPSTEPISEVPYRMALAEMRVLREQLQELREKRFICPSTSPWGAPVLFVKKKDGSLRL